MLTLYHNPSCSKSALCFSLLQNKGIAFKVINYLEEGLTRDILNKFVSKLTLSELVRKSDERYQILNLQDASESDILQALLKYPALLQRPIVDFGDEIIIARPPEKVLEYL